MNFREIQIELSKNKIAYYLRDLLRTAVPKQIWESGLESRLKAIDRYSEKEVLDRVNYYNGLHEITSPDELPTRLADIRKIEAPSAYLVDTFEYSRYFPGHLKAAFCFGDIIHVSPRPSIQKSRPISPDNANAVLLNLDKKRHFLFIKDPISYEDKLDMLIGRGVFTQPHRIDFMEKHFGNPSLDLGQVNKSGGNPLWIRPKISIYRHLRYKFILSLEGNDVATNLKWIMSSNSIAVMPKPKYETWFMEGRLKPNEHYIQIKDDYSDLPEVLDYYIKNPQEAKRIIRNAREHVSKFQDPEKEGLISLLVLEKYFRFTSQRKS